LEIFYSYNQGVDEKMKAEPLKDKMDEGIRMFEPDDVKAACEWLKEGLEWTRYECYGDLIINRIEEAFEDVYRSDKR
jgi:hypothetical protein